ncbi:MAG: transglycosylase SLT domain-containing protein, partial [Rhodocyclaceae bacterium]|nr:transglycosylase SLT domain-containing protein [Rhodocyclaceae bacterium]
MERYPSFFPPAPASELGLGDLPSLPRAPWQSKDEPPVPRASDAPRIQAFPDAGLGVADTRRARSPQQGDAQAILDRALEAEGAWELRPVAQAILMQESGARAGIRDSVDGAAGMMQVMPDTFRMVMGNEGDIRNPYDNARAAVRYMKRLNKYAKGDAARIAVGYFSGEGNINTSPDGTPYKHDRADGNGKRVSEYQSDVMRRINGSNGVDAPVRGTQQGYEMPGLDNAFSVAPSDIASIPKWSDIAKSDEYKRLPVKAQLDKKAQYFDLVAPHLAAEGENVEEMRRKFLYSVDDHRSGLEKTGNTLQNVAAGALKIGPTAVKGLANLGDMLTGGAVDWGVADAMERGMKSIDSTVGSDHLAKQQAVFGQLMQDENAGIADMARFAAQNPGMLANEATATVGSMLLPAGVAGAAAKVANTAKLAKGASAAVAKSAATKAATRASLATVGAQNAAETFSETKDAELADRYKAAAISGAVSLLAGMALGGGAEGMIARRLAGELQKGAPGAMSRAGAFLANIGKEAGQESLEELGGILGEWAGTGEMPNATNAGKQMAYAGLLGGLMGGGAHFASDGISPVTGETGQSEADSEAGQNGADRNEPSMPGLDAVNSTYADDGEDGGAGGAQISEENARALQDAIAQDLAAEMPGVDLNLPGQAQQQSKHPTEQTAEAIVEELATQAGIPLETVLPQRVDAPAQSTQAQPQAMQHAADTMPQQAALDERSAQHGEEAAAQSTPQRAEVVSRETASGEPQAGLSGADATQDALTAAQVAGQDAQNV